MSRLTELPVLELMCIGLAFSLSYALGRLSCYFITNVCHDMPGILMYMKVIHCIPYLQNTKGHVQA